MSMHQRLDINQQNFYCSKENNFEHYIKQKLSQRKDYHLGWTDHINEQQEKEDLNNQEAKTQHLKLQVVGNQPVPYQAQSLSQSPLKARSFSKIPDISPEKYIKYQQPSSQRELTLPHQKIIISHAKMKSNPSSIQQYLSTNEQISISNNNNNSNQITHNQQYYQSTIVKEPEDNNYSNNTLTTTMRQTARSGLISQSQKSFNDTQFQLIQPVLQLPRDQTNIKPRILQQQASSRLFKDKQQQLQPSQSLSQLLKLQQEPNLDTQQFYTSPTQNSQNLIGIQISNKSPNKHKSPSYSQFPSQGVDRLLKGHSVPRSTPNIYNTQEDLISFNKFIISQTQNPQRSQLRRREQQPAKSMHTFGTVETIENEIFQNNNNNNNYYAGIKSFTNIPAMLQQQSTEDIGSKHNSSIRQQLSESPIRNRFQLPPLKKEPLYPIGQQLMEGYNNKGNGNEQILEQGNIELPPISRVFSPNKKKVTFQNGENSQQIRNNNNTGYTPFLGSSHFSSEIISKIIAKKHAEIDKDKNHAEEAGKEEEERHHEKEQEELAIKIDSTVKIDQEDIEQEDEQQKQQEQEEETVPLISQQQQQSPEIIQSQVQFSKQLIESVRQLGILIEKDKSMQEFITNFCFVEIQQFCFLFGLFLNSIYHINNDSNNNNTKPTFKDSFLRMNSIPTGGTSSQSPLTQDILTQSIKLPSHGVNRIETLLRECFNLVKVTQIEEKMQIFQSNKSKLLPENLLDEVGGCVFVERVFSKFLIELIESKEFLRDKYEEQYEEILSRVRDGSTEQNQFIQLVCEYLKEDERIMCSPVVASKIQQLGIQLSSIDFFVLKKHLFQYLNSRHAVIGKTQILRLIQRVNALRRLICSDLIFVRKPNDLQAHILVSLKNYIPVNYMKGKQSLQMQQINSTQQVIGGGVGSSYLSKLTEITKSTIRYLIIQCQASEFLGLLNSLIIPEVLSETIDSLELVATQAFEIYCLFEPEDKEDFIHKFNVLRYILGYKVFPTEILPDRLEVILQDLSDWVKNCITEEPLPKEILLKDLEDTQLLEIILEFSRPEIDAFSANDSFAAFTVFNYTKSQFDFQIRGLCEVLKQRNIQKQYIIAVEEFLKEMFPNRQKNKETTFKLNKVSEQMYQLHYQATSLVRLPSNFSDLSDEQ